MLEEKIVEQTFTNYLLNELKLPMVHSTMVDKFIKQCRDASGQLDAQVKPQKHTYIGADIWIKNYRIGGRITKVENAHLPIMLFILTASILFFVFALIMFLSV
jgi:hypothetical protein